jgi:hypothetical protein
MKNILKKIISTATCVVLSAAMLTSVTAPASAASNVKHYNTQKQIATIKNRYGCTAAQGLAVGKKDIYTVKVKTDDEKKAIMSKINIKTGKVTNLKLNTGEKYFTNIRHANDLELITINGKENLYVNAMRPIENNIVRFQVNGSTLTQTASYTLKLNGEHFGVASFSIIKQTSKKITFLCKRGTTFYKGSVGINAKTGVVNLVKAFDINVTNVKINGKSTDLSTYIDQGVEYHGGKLFVPLWAGRSKSNENVIVVYDINEKTSGTIKSNPNLSFKITSKDFFEIEGCGISEEGKLYFNTNKDEDGVHVIKKYKFS